MIDNVKPVGQKPVKTNGSSASAKISKSSEPVFEPPESVAAKDNSEPNAQNNDAKSKVPVKSKKGFWPRLTRNQWLIIAGVAILLVGGGAGAFFAFHKKPAHKPAPVAKAQPKPPPPTNEASTLTGLQVSIGTNQLPVTGVMIENSPDARPQSGLLDAGVVFEAVAEGGITRFLALFQSDSVPGYLGPVRSARPYYLDYLSGFDAAIAHVGGSPDALNQIKAQGIKDLDEFANSGAYARVNTRYAPHNVYSSMAQLYELQKNKGFKSTFEGFPRKVEKPVTATPTAKTIDLAISGYLYSVHYDYDQPTNSYHRSEGGQPHMDERSKQEISPKVVIVIVVSKSTADDGIHSIYQDLGSGKAFVLQDGGDIVGTWAKADRTSQIKFTDAAGAAIPLNPGQTWITLIGSEPSISYKP